MPRDRAEQLYDAVFTDPHSFLFIDAQNGKLCNGWNELTELD